MQGVEAFVLSGLVCTQPGVLEPALESTWRTYASQKFAVYLIRPNSKFILLHLTKFTKKMGLTFYVNGSRKHGSEGRNFAPEMLIVATRLYQKR